jgi:predicted nucleic-acid-binding protein
MIGLDTNVLVRYFVGDDPVQATKARMIIEEELTAAEPGWINRVVLAELGWVLSRSYKRSDEEIADTVEWLLSVEQLRVEGPDIVSVAVDLCRRSIGDFADALIGATDREAGCRHTATFDRKATRLPEFELIET